MQALTGLLRKLGVVGSRFKVDDRVTKPASSISCGYTGRVWHVHDHGGRLRHRHVYEIIPDEPVAGSRHQLIAREDELEPA